jgi:hypothetical protein
MTIEEIIAALMSSHRADLESIRTYITWIRIRRRIYARFYFQAHWLKEATKKPAAIQAHWL